jgi:hypothetical protein
LQTAVAPEALTQDSPDCYLGTGLHHKTVEVIEHVLIGQQGAAAGSPQEDLLRAFQVKHARLRMVAADTDQDLLPIIEPLARLFGWTPSPVGHGCLRVDPPIG